MSVPCLFSLPPQLHSHHRRGCHTEDAHPGRGSAGEGRSVRGNVFILSVVRAQLGSPVG